MNTLTEIANAAKKALPGSGTLSNIRSLLTAPDTVDRALDDWLNFIDEIGGIPKIPELTEKHPPTGKLKTLIRRGIPNRLRVEVWKRMAGYDRHFMPGYFDVMLEQHAHETTRATEDIEQDLPRTFPNHPLFQTPEGIGKLRNLLKVWAFHKPEVGYCQSMNFLAGILLIVGFTAEEGFYMFAHLMELIPNYYVDNLKEADIEMHALDTLLKERLPRVHVLLHENMLETSHFALQVAIPSPPLPAHETFQGPTAIVPLADETTLRIWDAIYAEGDKILFRVALAIMKQAEGPPRPIPAPTSPLPCTVLRCLTTSG
ncbi:putative TBC1 domain family member 2B [Paratrimastix pyriformis]|uniref:TBC1 domain family member 2B n=1 Tax=Paratrimastix pyriformis TaxID=342808 RepID=A0ABQ8USI2_9EUKA|nr:putative TBC1 domain family member 2B [Paratrimastix pyriformis]